MFWIFSLLGLFIIIIIIVILSVVFSFIKKDDKNDDKFWYLRNINKWHILYNKYRFNITPDFLEKDQTKKSNVIQKNIFRLWCDDNKCGGRDINNYKKSMEMTRKNLPGWNEIIFYDSQYKNFLIQEFGKDHPVLRGIFLINPVYGAARADLMRYLLIYKFGGLYLDIKSYVSSKIPEIPKNKDAWFSYWNEYKYYRDIIGGNGEIQNWFVYAKKGSPIIKDIINEIVNNILSYHNNQDYYQYFLEENQSKKKQEILSITGPIAVTIAISKSKNRHNIIINDSINQFIHYELNTSNFDNQHYSFLTAPLLISFKHEIPKIVYFTYDDLNNIPNSVIENIYKYCKGFEIKIFDDDMCIGFLNKYYGERAVDIFLDIKTPAHKADFWRYCILYLFGGYYFDIKTVFQIPIGQIFKDGPRIMYSVLSKVSNSIYNGILVTQPNNEILWNALLEFYKYKKIDDYHHHTKFLFKELTRYSESKILKVGENILTNNWKCIIFKEKCVDCAIEKCAKPKDRYNFNCVINNPDEKIYFETRYSDFPWKKKDVNDSLYENPFLKGQFIKWQDINTDFMIHNFPNSFDFDFEIKKHILDSLIDAPLDVAIIDCGCHIGDGSVPIASFLKRKGRDDITIYGIDPSEYKINFLNTIQKKNNLYNLKTINTGLSNKIDKYTHMDDDFKNNTGGIRWTSIDKKDASKNNEKMKFTTLDTLVKEGIIKKHIYYIHLDIEEMELYALQGAVETLKKYNPILSIEEHQQDDDTIKKFLTSIGYQFIERIINNNIYTPMNT